MTFAAIKAFLNRHPWALRALVILAVFAAGFGTAIVSRPAKVVEHTKTITVEKTVAKTQATEQAKVEQKVDAARDRHVHRVVVVAKQPSGAVTTTTTEDEDDTAQRHEATTATQVKYVTQEVVKWQDRIVEKTVTKTSQPDWDAHVDLGVSIPQLLGGPETGVPGMRGFVVGAGLDRRIIGPFWLGVWGNTLGAAGVDGRLTW